MSNLKNNKVMIASEQAIYRRGLCSLVMSIPGISLVGEAHNCQDTLNLCKMSEPDLLILDLKIILDHWQQAICNISRQWSTMQIILLVDPSEEKLAREKFEDVPLYLFSRDMSGEEFNAAIINLLEGPAQHEGTSNLFHPSFQKTGFEYPADDGSNPPSLSEKPVWHRSEELISRELIMAGKIQADILPEEAPHIPGWEISAKLEPARETSGDFYDFIPLTDHKWGIAVADVTDKGMGAAIFMALSSSLFRTYATRFPTLPAVTLNAVSTRILADTRGCMFVTMFFGILEPHADRLVFANAGHPPGYLISTHGKKASYERLQPTGMALGVSEEAQWKQKVVRFNPGDILLLYTDGITEAQAPDGDFFGEDRLVDLAFSLAGCQAETILDSILKEVHNFVGNVAPQDDIALIVVRRVD